MAILRVLFLGGAKGASPVGRARHRQVGVGPARLRRACRRKRKYLSRRTTKRGIVPPKVFQLSIFMRFGPESNRELQRTG